MFEILKLPRLFLGRVLERLFESASDEKSYSREMSILLASAVKEAERRKHNYVGTEHVVYAMIFQSSLQIHHLLAGLTADFPHLKFEVDNLLTHITCRPSNRRPFTKFLKKCLLMASDISLNHTITPLHLVVSMLTNEVCVGGKILNDHGITLEKLKTLIGFQKQEKQW
jgi:ATP-dependent Clp protease ATP-binding subunit ClpC